MSRVGIGIDFGTTNSGLSIFDGREVHLLPLEGEALIVPTASYIDTDFASKTGQEAIDQYISDNTGRTVELISEAIGLSQILVGNVSGSSRAAPETLKQLVYGQPMDAGLKGRLFRGLKRLLGQQEVADFKVFGKPMTLPALIQPVLSQIYAVLEEADLLADSVIYMGRPIVYEGRGDQVEQRALQHFDIACKAAGFDQYQMYPEPIAALQSYRYEQYAGHADGVMLSFDFGGGTLDLSLVNIAKDMFQVLSTVGLPVGGDHIDRRLFEKILFPLLGEGERWVRQGEKRVIDTLFPFHPLKSFLLNWPITYLLNQNHFIAPVLACAEKEDEAAWKFRRLRDLIHHNYGYLVFRALSDLKEKLSTADEACLDIPELDVQYMLSRVEFEAMISDILHLIEKSLTDVLASANVAASDVRMIICTGGSSLIPVVQDILKAHFPNAELVKYNPFSSVAKGLSVAAYYDQAI